MTLIIDGQNVHPFNSKSVTGEVPVFEYPPLKTFTV